MKKTLNKIFTKGQASPLFEQPININSQDECNFYHTTDIPGIGLAVGQWDLRDGFHEYLGEFDFSGKRVLEIGPAISFLTFEIEKTAWEIVAVELPMDRSFWNSVPYEELGLSRRRSHDWTDVEKQFHQQLADNNPLTMFTVVSSRPGK